VKYKTTRDVLRYKGCFIDRLLTTNFLDKNATNPFYSFDFK